MNILFKHVTQNLHKDVNVETSAESRDKQTQTKGLCGDRSLFSKVMSQLLKVTSIVRLNGKGIKLIIKSNNFPDIGEIYNKLKL